MSNTRSSLHRLIITAILLAVGLVLPFLTGQIPTLGKVISPLHIPALICGLTCGPLWGAVLGLILPPLRSLLFGMPAMIPTGLRMAFELMAYGLLGGLLYPLLRSRLKAGSHLPAILLAMVIAMIGGRLVGGAAQAIILGATGGSYTFAAFVAAYFVNTAVGALIHLVLVPAIVLALEKAKLSPLR